MLSPPHFVTNLPLDTPQPPAHPSSDIHLLSSPVVCWYLRFQTVQSSILGLYLLTVCFRHLVKDSFFISFNEWSVPFLLDMYLNFTVSHVHFLMFISHYIFSSCVIFAAEDIFYKCCHISCTPLSIFHCSWPFFPSFLYALCILCC